MYTLPVPAVGVVAVSANVFGVAVIVFSMMIGLDSVPMLPAPATAEDSEILGLLILAVLLLVVRLLVMLAVLPAFTVAEVEAVIRLEPRPITPVLLVFVPATVERVTVGAVRLPASVMPAVVPLVLPPVLVSKKMAPAVDALSVIVVLVMF